MKLASPRCYSDSKVTLFWIQGVDKDWKPFVRNRVLEIRRLIPVECWSLHCSGRENSADIPSCGLPALELSVNKLWIAVHLKSSMSCLKNVQLRLKLRG